MKIGYARVSTISQDLESQIELLKEAGCEEIYNGKRSGISIANEDALNELVSYARSGDVVIVTKLDRLGRSLSQVLSVLNQLTRKEVTLITLDGAVDTSTNDPMKTAMIQLLGMFAELERNFIVSRCQEGRKRTGNLGGRKPKLTDEQKSEVNLLFADGMSKSKLSKKYNVSRSTILTIVSNTNNK